MEKIYKKEIAMFLLVLILLLGSPLLLAQLKDAPKERELIKQDSFSDHYKLPNGKIEATFYGFPINVREDNQWKRFDEARSLMNDEFHSYSISFLERDKNLQVDIIDFNITSITFNLNMSKDLQGENIPIRVWEINRSKLDGTDIDSENFKEFYEEVESREIIQLKDSETYTETIGIGKILGIGLNTTILTLDSTSGIYDGTTTGGSNRADTATSILVGDLIVPIRGFMEFNTSTITDGATITDVDLNLTVSIAYGAGDTVDITRFNNSQINDLNNYSDDTPGNTALFNNISTGYDGAGNTPSPLGAYVTSSAFQTAENILIDLGTDADMDLQSQLSNDYFSMGFFGSDEINTQVTEFTSSEGLASERPKLIVTYEPCIYSGIGNWVINETCIITGDHINLSSSNSIFILDDGALVLNGGTNISFTGTNQFINLSEGGGVLNISSGGGIGA